MPTVATLPIRPARRVIEHVSDVDVVKNYMNASISAVSSSWNEASSPDGAVFGNLNLIIDQLPSYSYSTILLLILRLVTSLSEREINFGTR